MYKETEETSHCDAFGGKPNKTSNISVCVQGVFRCSFVQCVGKLEMEDSEWK